jgi:hypothetical protein
LKYHVQENILALPGLAWVKIEPAAVEVDGDLKVLDVPEAAGHALDLLNLAVESFAHRVGHRMLVVGQDVVDVPANRVHGELVNHAAIGTRTPILSGIVRGALEKAAMLFPLPRKKLSNTKQRYLVLSWNNCL